MALDADLQIREVHSVTYAARTSKTDNSVDENRMIFCKINFIMKSSTQKHHVVELSTVINNTITLEGNNDTNRTLLQSSKQCKRYIY